VQVTDTHVEEGQGRRSSSDVLSQDLQELVHQSRPDLIVHSGDLTQLGTLEQLRCFHQAIETIEPPVFPLFGNHDGSEEFTSRDGAVIEEVTNRQYPDDSIFEDRSIERYSIVEDEKPSA